MDKITIDPAYKRGYEEGYKACSDKYNDRDFDIIYRTHSYEHIYVLPRSDFKENLRFYHHKQEFGEFIDNHIFKVNVKKPRSSVEILQLGKWFMVTTSYFRFDLDDIPPEEQANHIVDQIRHKLLNHYYDKFIKQIK